jgi:nucleoside-diphosphate-sugar epimerase
MIQEVTGVPIVTEFSSLPEDDPRRRRPDLTRAQELISWNPQVSLRLGLSITWANLQKPGMPNHQLANSVVEKQA